MFFNVGREGFEPTEAIKATDLQSAYFDHLHIYPNRSGSETRTHVVRLMRPLWGHLQSSRDIKKYSILPNQILCDINRTFYLIEGNTGVKPV